MSRWMRAILVCLLGLSLHAGAEGDGKSEAPSGGFPVKVRYGVVDAVTGALQLNVPIGPRLPGRIPLGFVWSFNSQDSLRALSSTYPIGGSFSPIIWPLTTQNRSMVMTVVVGGQPWTFQKSVATGVTLPSTTQLRSWMAARGVDDGYSQAIAAGTNPIFQVSALYPSSDGTRFLVYSQWQVTSLLLGGNGTPTTSIVGKRVTILDADRAIYTNSLTDSTSWIRSIWGDRIQISSSWSHPGAGTNITILNQITNESINLTVTEGTPSLDNTHYRFEPGVKITVTNNLGYPGVAVYGDYTEAQRWWSPDLLCGDSSSIQPYPLGIWDNGFRLSSMTANGVTTFTWGSSSAPTTIVHPTGLTEQFEYSNDGGNWGGLSYQPCTGYWMGFKALWPISPLGDMVDVGSPGVSRVVFTGTGVSQSVVIRRKQPQFSVGGSLITWSQTDHQTAIFNYEDKDSTGSYRGTILTHPGSAGVTGDINDPQGYLFATSAILKAEAVKGSGSVGSGFPSGYSVYQTTVFDGFDLRCWANPTGTLSQGLAIEATPRRVSTATPNLPTKTTIASGWDGVGCTQTDEYTNAPTSPSFSATPVWYGSVSAPSTPIQRTGVITRHWDASLMRLMSDTDQKTVEGPGLPSLRQVTTTPVNFGTTTYQYDSMGRVHIVTGQRGAFTATETRLYSGTNPNPYDVTKTLTGPDGTYYPNPTQTGIPAGKAYAYAPAPHYFLTSTTDKTDGRTISYTPDLYGRPTQTTDVLGFVTHASYDPWGRGPTSVSRDARGSVGSTSTSFTYDYGSQVTLETTTMDGKTLQTTRNFDALERILSETKPGGRKQTTTYTGFGQVNYQSPWLLPGQSDFGGSRYTYDDKGRLTTTTYRGKLVASTPNDPAWNGSGVVSTSYGPGANVGDPNGSRAVVTDLLGQRSSVTDQAGKTSTFRYDKDGHLITVNQGAQSRTYVYNDMGWLTSRTEPEEGSTSFSQFSQLGSPMKNVLTGRTGAASITTTLTLNTFNLPATITVNATGAPSLTRTLGYDPTTRALTSVGEPQASGTITETYTNDELGRPLSKTIHDELGQTFSISQTLDSQGHVTTFHYPSGGGRATQVASYGVDPIFRVKDVWLDSIKRGHMDYDAVSGSAVTNVLTYGNGATTTTKVDRERLAEITHRDATWTLLEDSLVQWSDAGLMVSRGNDTFQYDTLQRLKGATVQGLNAGEVLTQGFGYDDYGNRSSSAFSYTGPQKPDEVLAWSAAPDGATNELPSSVLTASGPLDTGAHYDDLGRLTQALAIPGNLATFTEWTYDAAGNVVGENGASYLLDASGLRFRRTKSDGSVRYTVYGFNHEPLAVFERAAIPALPTLIGGGTLEPGDARITQPTSAVTCYPGNPIPFTGATNTGTTGTWDFKDGTTATGLSAIHAWSLPGTYNVTFTVKSSGYLTAIAMVSITVLNPGVSITVSPGSASIMTGGTASFTATVTGTTNTAVSWTVTGGQLSSSTAPTVTYTAPGTPGTYILTVTSMADSTKFASATVTVNAPVSVALDTSSAIVPINGSFAFTATVTGAANTAVAWSIRSGAGSLSSTTANPVTFTAPSTAQTVVLRATSAADSTKFAEATITVSTGLVINLNKTTATLLTGTSTTFQATVSGATNTAVLWSIRSGGGSLSSYTANPVTYTAPSTPQTVVLRATCQADMTTYAETAITVVGVMISLDKTTATLATGATTTFQATVTGSTNTAVLWSIQSGAGTLGSNSANPVSFTAPPTAQTVVLRATSVAAPSQYAQATITVTSGISVSVSPSTLTLLPGQSQVMTATVTGTTNTNVTWTASGGTIPTSGNPVTYTAPATVGSYTITVRSQADPSKLATIPVQVANVSLPVISNFQALPTTISQGASATLTWSVSNVSSVTISGISGSQAASGSISVSPSATTVYTLTASNAAGSATSSVQVTVLGPLTWVRTVVYGFGTEVSEEKPNGTFYLMTDQVGSPNYILDSTGNVMGRSKNLPFGERFGSSGEASIRRFTNHEDQDGSPIYMQARMYLPAYGKFAQPDPAYDQVKADPETYNLYTYVTNNPVTRSDPDGRKIDNPDDDKVSAGAWAASMEAFAGGDGYFDPGAEDRAWGAEKAAMEAMAANTTTEQGKPSAQTTQPQAKKAVEDKPATDQKKHWWSSGFWHGLFSGDGSGTENKPENFRQDARDDIHKLAKANGTASPGPDPSSDPEDRAAQNAAGRQAEIGRNLPAAALRGALEVQGTGDTEHKITGGWEGFGVYLHQKLFDWGKDKVKEEVRGRLNLGSTDN